MSGEDDTGQSVGGFGQPPWIEPECPFNPFRNDSEFSSVFEISKTLILVPLFVIRICLWALTLLLGFLCTKLALIGAKDVLTRPFPHWRRLCLFPIRFLARLLLFSCGFQWIHVKGEPAPRSKAPILICNHVTFIDPVFIFFRHLPVIVTAQENLSLPVVGSIMRAMQVISVNRANQDSRRHASSEIKRRAMCNDWSHVMLFPEATTTNGKSLVAFKAGAFTPGYAVQPIVVRYPHVHLDPSWVAEGPPIHVLIFRLMTQFHNYMQVEYLPIIEPTLQEQRNPRDFAERVRLTMAKALNVNVTEHTYEDGALAVEAVKRNLRSGMALVEFTKFEKLFHLNIKEAKKYFSKFCAMDIYKRGVLYYEDFLSALELPDCRLLRRVFMLFDRSGQGFISFRQFTAGLAFLAKHKKFKEASERTFKYCDADEDGLLDISDIETSLRDIVPPISDKQVQKVFDKIDMKQAGIVSRGDFSKFLEDNPEYLALFLISRPDLVPSAKNDELETSYSAGRKTYYN